jgi:molybdate transport system substrate-binding protein
MRRTGDAMPRTLLIGLVLIVGIATCMTVHARPAEVSVYAAGSLRAAITEAAQAWQAAEPNARVKFTFGASGLLKERLAGGERADVFASANLDHPQALAAAGRAAAPRVFARNQLCALVASGVVVSADTLVGRMLDPTIRVGTSTPKADPAGDYAWAMFERIEQSGHRGAFNTLSGKALQLTGGPNSPPPPSDRSVYGAVMAAGQADIFITYCTGAVVAVREVPSLRSVDVPADVNVSASYGVAQLNGASAEAGRFVDFLLAPAGQAVLARHGFAPP